MRNLTSHLPAPTSLNHSINTLSTDTLDSALEALSAFLAEAKAKHLVLIGGAALLAHGFISRTTRDVDIMAGVDAHIGLVDPRPMSDALQSAAAKVARELLFDPLWLNTGPADQVKAGLPVCRRRFKTGFVACSKPDSPLEAVSP